MNHNSDYHLIEKYKLLENFEYLLTELPFFPSTIFSPILLKGIPYQNLGRFEPARVRGMNHISEYHLIEKYKLLENFEYRRNYRFFRLLFFHQFFSKVSPIKIQAALSQPG
jgi:hypothetical protein